MSRRRHRRRRNPIDNKTLIYVGAGLAVLGVGYILYQNSQANAAASTPALPASSGSGPTNVVAALSPYEQCIANGGNVASCLGL